VSGKVKKGKKSRARAVGISFSLSIPSSVSLAVGKLHRWRARAIDRVFLKGMLEAGEARIVKCPDSPQRRLVAKNVQGGQGDAHTGYPGLLSTKRTFLSIRRKKNTWFVGLQIPPRERQRGRP